MSVNSHDHAVKLMARDEARLAAANTARLPGLRARLDATPCGATEKSMVELGIFLAAMIALVVCGCMATRAPKKTS
jgi:hypothetical protein